MIGLLIATILLLPFAFDAAPDRQPEAACPADTVYYHIKTHTDWVMGVPVETVDTTWVIRSKEMKRIGGTR